jgi:hypothetical protein
VVRELEQEFERHIGLEEAPSYVQLLLEENKEATSWQALPFAGVC